MHEFMLVAAMMNHSNIINKKNNKKTKNSLELLYVHLNELMGDLTRMITMNHHRCHLFRF